MKILAMVITVLAVNISVATIASSHCMDIDYLSCAGNITQENNCALRKDNFKLDMVCNLSCVTDELNQCAKMSPTFENFTVYYPVSAYLIRGVVDKCCTNGQGICQPSVATIASEQCNDIDYFGCASDIAPDNDCTLRVNFTLNSFRTPDCVTDELNQCVKKSPTFENFTVNYPLPAALIRGVVDKCFTNGQGICKPMSVMTIWSALILILIGIATKVC